MGVYVNKTWNFSYVLAKLLAAVLTIKRKNNLFYSLFYKVKYYFDII